MTTVDAVYIISLPIAVGGATLIAGHVILCLLQRRYTNDQIYTGLKWLGIGIFALSVIASAVTWAIR